MLQQEFDFGEELADHVVDEHVRRRAGGNALRIVKTVPLRDLHCPEYVEVVGDDAH